MEGHFIPYTLGYCEHNTYFHSKRFTTLYCTVDIHIAKIKLRVLNSNYQCSLTPTSHPVLKTTWSLNQIAFKAIDIMSLRQLDVHIVRPLNVHVSILWVFSIADQHFFVLRNKQLRFTATCIAFTYLDILFILVLYHWHQQGNAPTNHVLVSSYGETRWNKYLNFTFNSLPE